ncbi:hypothetical protein LIER_04684 [Lithospermum erythrorhizon]|uniref:Uncharacterized protein n=1 Tax=Lithospermum erythrorhizon TaxID=34254 RepID=A0AAV3NY20_LITER
MNSYNKSVIYDNWENRLLNGNNIFKRNVMIDLRKATRERDVMVRIFGEEDGGDGDHSGGDGDHSDGDSDGGGAWLWKEMRDLIHELWELAF